MKKIKELLFGKRAESLGPIKIGCTTKCFGAYTTFSDWCQEFRVGMLHDRKALYIDNIKTQSYDTRRSN
jgi:fluoride ion exporter CrcB/FEX